MLLIPVKCLAILRAVWNFSTFGFSKSPGMGVREARFQIQAKTPDHRRSKKRQSRSLRLSRRSAN